MESLRAVFAVNLRSFSKTHLRMRRDWEFFTRLPTMSFPNKPSIGSGFPSPHSGGFLGFQTCSAERGCNS